MKHRSIWEESISYDVMPSLKEDITCDILIIGGGMAGLSTALKLKDEKYNTVLIDKGVCGFGVTSKTTGKLTYLQSDIYTKIEKIYDFSVAKQYLESQKEAIKIARDNIYKYNIDCDFKENKSFLFETGEDKKLNKERDFLLRAKEAYQDKNLPINIPSNDAFYVSKTAVFHPLKYLQKIKQIILESGIKIYENTCAIDLDIAGNYYVVKTPKGSIKAIKVIVCSHYPFFVVPGLMPLRLGLNRSYVIAAKRKNKDFNAINIDKTVYSVRYHNDYLILGGFSHNLNDKFNYTEGEEKLITFYNNHFKPKIDYVWQVHDVTTHDHMPIIGKLNYNHPNLLVATGFNKWGMTNGILAGEILGDIVLNKKNKYEQLFNPSRPLTPQKILKALEQNYKMGKAFLLTKLKVFETNKTYITNIGGVKCGVYIDEKGNKHIVKNICPHLKCSLVFNTATKTWDCPCHGSRFSLDGELIEGPSVFDIKINKI